MLQNRLHSYSLFFIVLTIICLGSFLMYSASSPIAFYNYNKSDSYFLFKHLIWLIIGISTLFIFSFIDCNFLKKHSKTILFIAWILMLIPMILNIETNSTYRWLKIGNFTIMTTSDFSRIALIIFTAAFIDKYHQKINNITILINKLLPYLLVTIGLIIYQPDLSTSIVTSIIIFSLLYIAGLNNKIIFGVLSGFVLCFASIISFFPHMSKRITYWIYGLNNQSSNSILSLANGGFFGTGIGHSKFKYDNFIPESQTDFVLAIIGEETGFLGIIIIFVLFGFLFYKGLKLSRFSRDRFSMFLSIGITVNIFLYLIINSSYVIGILPTTGLPIPFISYGGSQTIFSLLSIGILISISKTNLHINNSRYYYGN